MSGVVMRFPPRRDCAIRVIRDRLDGRRAGWLVLRQEHGWAHGDRTVAIADANWLADHHGEPVILDTGS